MSAEQFKRKYVEWVNTRYVTQTKEIAVLSEIAELADKAIGELEKQCERLKEERNRAGMEVRRELIPKCQELQERAERVPQCEHELKCAEHAVREWREMAERLYGVIGLSRLENRRKCVEEAYRQLMKQYEPI